MKKFIAIVIGIIGLLAFAGCNNGTDGNLNQPAVSQPRDITTSNMTATYDAGVFSPAIALEGAWTNRLGETIVFFMPNISHITRTPNGAYVLEIMWDVGESRVWLFPVGIEMIRYNALGERMYNESVVSDISQVRLFNGDFEVTSCCTDEDINLTLFFHQGEHAEIPQNNHMQQGFYVPFSDSLLFIYQAEDVNLESFNVIYSLHYPWVLSAEHADLLIGATRQIYNVSLVMFEHIWDGVANEDGFTIIDELWISDSLQPGEGINLSGYVVANALPWSGITFTVAPGERYFFAINRDHSNNPYSFVLLNITGQILVG
ncbi:MAG: hypothetical protein FWE05_00025 [Defluviitaleaceae bacterium]|nr:hypothetical protein [Defluviitaleaceae bacterium]